MKGPNAYTAFSWLCTNDGGFVMRVVARSGSAALNALRDKFGKGWNSARRMTFQEMWDYDDGYWPTVLVVSRSKVDVVCEQPRFN